MRPIERIDDFLELVDWDRLFKSWGLEFDNKKYYYLEDFHKLFIQYWKSNPGQRIGQVLINLGIITDSPEAWNKEDYSILIEQGLPPEECLYWTSIYDENENILEEPITRKVSTLTEAHLKRIIEFMHTNGGKISMEMDTAFLNMLDKYKKQELEEIPLAA